MDFKTYSDAKKLYNEICRLKGIIESIHESGVRLEYMEESDHGRVPRLLIVDEEVNGLILKHYRDKLDAVRKEFEDL